MPSGKARKRSVASPDAVRTLAAQIAEVLRQQDEEDPLPDGFVTTSDLSRELGWDSDKIHSKLKECETIMVRRKTASGQLRAMRAYKVGGMLKEGGK